MEKVLKKYSTIPPHLYVKRRADKQLSRIVDEMQRPGYVLVARQMGKTNLLLNAMRENKSDDRLFAYVDLSNNFLEERDCYRNIIDCIIEPNEELFSAITADINLSRMRKDLPPHKEYSSELRMLLKSFKGKLIIILDEIDALRSVGYSDHIFAQIRSNYFARTNFPEFERLTYVLSGVVEPTDLIKDKNKSPFNIGEKIYLDDFTISEHEQFIQKSKLAIDKEISDEIFAWTNGNPRLTFDICSDIEDLLIEGESVSAEVLAELINKKYLVQYDLAPIDHIRDIVATNKQIRRAVINIQKGKDIDSVDIKRRLYLYGIIDSNLDSQSTLIKNRIIKESLPIEWLEAIEHKELDLFSIGLGKIDSAEYPEAISMLEKFLENQDAPDFNRKVASYNIGYAYYKIGEYLEAIEAYDRYPSELSDNKELHWGAKTFKGICYITLDRFEEGLKLLHEVRLSDQRGFPYRNAVLNLINYYSKDEPDRALSYVEELIERTSNDSSKDARINRILALVIKSQILDNRGEIDEAVAALESAISQADISDSLELLFFKYKVQRQPDVEILLQICDLILKNRLDFNVEEDYDVSFVPSNFYRYLLELREKDLTEPLEDLLGYALSTLFEGVKSRQEILYYAANHSLNNPQSLYIFKELLENTEGLDDYQIFDSSRNVLLYEINRDRKYEQVFEIYLNLFRRLELPLSISDISAFAFQIKCLSDRYDLDQALNLCKIMEHRLVDLDDSMRRQSLIIYYWFANIYFSKRDALNATIYADKTLNIIGSTSSVKTGSLDEKGVKLVAEQMNQVKISSRIQTPIVRQTKKYGRNDAVKVAYLDGSVREGKYKRFEADILAERCKLITS